MCIRDRRETERERDRERETERQRQRQRQRERERENVCKRARVHMSCAGVWLSADNSPEHFRVLLVGKSGSGKSSTGNTLLGQDVFPTSAAFSRVTNTSTTGVSTHRGVTLEVGLFTWTAAVDTCISVLHFAKTQKKQSGSASICPHTLEYGKYADVGSLHI